MKSALRKLTSVAVAVLMTALLVPAAALAQSVPATTPHSDNAKITIQNAAKGETYSVYKLFDAQVAKNSEETSDSIVYTGTVPTELSAYFAEDDNGYITAKEKPLSPAAITAITNYVKAKGELAVSATSDGTALEFTNLQYGYYVVTTTQGTAISVDSTNPDVTIYDKNGKAPGKPVKKVDDADVYIGQTVTYTVSFSTSNYEGEGATAKKITSYTIEDTLPTFLSNVIVKSILVDNDGDTTTTTNDQTTLTVTQFDDEKKIVIPWTNTTTGESLYKNGATVVITYEATVTDTAAIAGTGNTNTVTLTWAKDDNTTGGGGTNYSDEETIKTYAIALKKVDDAGKSLTGATFELPFYVKKATDANGAYIYAFETLPEGSNTEDYTNSITTPDTGEITIKGLQSGAEVSITETAAPNGYNRLTSPVKVTPSKLTETQTNFTTYLNENGEITNQETTKVVTYQNNNIAADVVVVVNKAGSTLPSTGGIGTTIFYVGGGILIVGALAAFIIKRRSKKHTA
ncbi:SpaH/EbpB family LPXTG-anchored major pilin [Adlercreutzia sp. ZJ141]|uniref:SpaH/EbpB family LPXTG-anchored major pilin n=1 Tax=Adlercreutzia sp. ZJ141 TaxID=2709406 RepID=UPI0013EBB558|nr:SpaH/EbpB family LPXTG-anchored major pilin [Adlercreutzia sp. ZJ141]